MATKRNDLTKEQRAALAAHDEFIKSKRLPKSIENVSQVGRPVAQYNEQKRGRRSNAEYAARSEAMAPKQAPAITPEQEKKKREEEALAKVLRDMQEAGEGGEDY